MASLKDKRNRIASVKAMQMVGETEIHRVLEALK